MLGLSRVWRRSSDDDDEETGVESKDEDADGGAAERALREVWFSTGCWKRGDLERCRGAVLLYAGCLLLCSITNLTACHVFAVHVATAAVLFVLYRSAWTLQLKKKNCIPTMVLPRRSPNIHSFLLLHAGAVVRWRT